MTRHLRLARVYFIFAALAGCEEGPSNNPGGGAAGFGAVTSASGGSGLGAAAGIGGAVATGGMPASTAGAAAVGGSAGNAAGSAAGGASSAGSPSGGSGAGGAEGGTSGAGGAAAGASVGGSSGTGGAGTAGAAGTSGAAGTGGMPNTKPTGVTVTTRDFGVQSLGTVFNVADNYFNDGLVPATPVANFGCHSQITAVVSDDGSLDIAWLDYANGKGKPWAVTSPGTIYVTHVDAALANATTQSTGLKSYKLLGFTKDAAGAFYVAYNKDHALKTSAQGDQNNINGNELHVAKLSGGGVAWDQLMFGNQDNNANETKGDPGGAASGVLGYDPTHQRLVLYVGHSMMWTPTRHQAGYLRLVNPANGAVIAPAGNDVIHFGSGWWFSHNFNQRLLIDGGYYYVLAHGDAYDRQLAFARWSVENYSGKNDADFKQSYFGISGNLGDNNTNAQTGQMARLANGKFVIVHTTSQGRGARDVRVVTADGSSGAVDGGAARWLTSNQGTVHATMPKVEVLGDNLLVTYALWDSSKKHDLVWYAALLDSSLQTVASPHAVPNVEFVDAAPLFRFKGGPNAGKVGWASGNASHTLSVRVASLRYE